MCVYLPIIAQLTVRTTLSFIDQPSGTTAQLRVRWSRRDGSALPRSAYERGSTLYLRGVEAGDAGDYACEAVDARSGAVVFTAVTTLAVSGDFTRRSTLDENVSYDRMLEFLSRTGLTLIGYTHFGEDRTPQLI